MVSHWKATLSPGAAIWSWGWVTSWGGTGKGEGIKEQGVRALRRETEGTGEREAQASLKKEQIFISCSSLLSLSFLSL